MFEFLPDYILFLAETATIVLALLVVAIGLVTIFSRGKKSKKGRLEIRSLNRKFDGIRLKLQRETLGKKEFKTFVKRQKKESKARGKDRKPRTFVLRFEGDLKASAVESLREEISAVILAWEPEDEVLLRLESPGGMVHAYGLAASQLDRLKAKGIRLTVVVDKIAASGGYLMACVADRIVAAPFSVIGSIGVVAQLPNFNRWLKGKNVDFEQITAGEYKRTLSLFGENTEQGREKFKQEIEETHLLFKEFVHRYRQNLDLQKIATGEHWYGTQAKELGLVDEIGTSDDLLLEKSRSTELVEVVFDQKKGFAQKLGLAVEERLGRLTASG